MTEEVAVRGPEIVSPLGLANEFDRVNDAGIYHLKGYKYSEIAELLDCSPRKAKQYVQEYRALVQQEIDQDPYFLEKVQFNTLKTLKEYDEISKEIWETIEVATEGGQLDARMKALKLAIEIATKKAQLQQLLGGGASQSADEFRRLQKAERVNNILSGIIRDVVSDCPRCSEMARVLLSEAFNLIEEENMGDSEVPSENVKVDG